MPQRKKQGPTRLRRAKAVQPRRKSGGGTSSRRSSTPAPAGPARRSPPAPARGVRRSAPAPARAPRRVVSLERAVSKFGIASRAEARFLILEDRVHVNGVIERNPTRRVDPDLDRLMVDNVPVQPAKPLYWMLNKPLGYVTTARDPDGRPTVYDLLPRGLPFVSAVGRLDYQSSGLLLFTNDTQFAAKLTSPESHVPKVYEVTLDAPVSAALARQLEQGVVVQGRRTLPARLRLAQPGASLRVTVTLYEGRNRQVRRMFDSVGRTVVWLQRVRIGPVMLDGLGSGEARPLTDVEVRALRQASR